MSTSRAVLLLGMHRSGTSAIARGLGALGVYLGNDFLDAQPENPTGYWEDKGIVALNERLLGALGLTWDNTSPVGRRAFERRRVRALRRDAIRYLNADVYFGAAVGLQGSAHDSGAAVLATRTARLRGRRLLPGCDSKSAKRCRLTLYAPSDGRGYRLPLMAGAYGAVLQRRDRQAVRRRGLRPFDAGFARATPRIGDRLGVPFEAGSPEIERFVSGFLDASLRHSVLTPEDFDDRNEVARLTRDAYLRLYDLAVDRADEPGSFAAGGLGASSKPG